MVTWTPAPREGLQPGCRTGAHKSLTGPWTSKLKIETGNYAQSFYCYSFIYSVLCKSIDKIKLLSIYSALPFLLVGSWEYLNCCCFIFSLMH